MKIAIRFGANFKASGGWMKELLGWYGFHMIHWQSDDGAEQLAERTTTEMSVDGESRTSVQASSTEDGGIGVLGGCVGIFGDARPSASRASYTARACASWLVRRLGLHHGRPSLLSGIGVAATWNA